MRALLDVNVLIALLDSDHSLHEQAATWFAQRAPGGWASSPITQNGCARIMSHPSYPNPLPVSAVIGRLSQACESKLHQFWPDDISMLDPSVVDARKIHGPRQLTDLYLLALAVRHKGQFVTFERTIAPDAVVGTDKTRLLIL